MKRRTPRVQVASSDIAITPTIQAPSLVNSSSKAAGQAAALSNALGFAGEVVEDNLQRTQDSDINAGQLAAQQGDVSEENLAAMQKSAAFTFGAEKILAQQRIIVDAAGARELYQTEFDKNKSLPELQTALKGYWDNLYAGVSTGIAREIAPLMAAANASILAGHAKFQEEQTQVQLIDAQRTILGDALQSGNLAPDLWEKIRQQGSASIGKEAQNNLAVEAIDQFAQENKDETIWQRPEFAKLRDNARFKDIIAASIDTAKRARQEAAESQTIADQGIALAEIGRLADSADPRIFDVIRNGSRRTEEGVLLIETEAQAASFINRFYNAVGKEQVGSIDAIAWRAGNGRVIGSDEKRDAAFAKDTENFVKETGATPEQTRAYQIERSVVNNFIPSQLKAEIEVSPQNDAFINAVALVDQFNAEDPAFAGRHINSDVTRDMNTFRRLRVERGSDEAALEALRETNPALIKEIGKQQLAVATQSIVDELGNGPLFSTLVKDSARLRVMVKEDLEFFINRGQSVPEAITSSVQNLLPGNGRFVEVGGQLFRNTEGWPTNPADAERAAELAKEAFAAEQELTGFFGSADPDKVSMTPIPNRPGWVRIAPVSELALLGSMTDVPISLIVEGFEESLKEGARVKATGLREALSDKAKAALVPIPIIGKNDDPERNIRLLKERDRRWYLLTQAQRDALMERQRS